jgi:hypothetical protein
VQHHDVDVSVVTNNGNDRSGVSECRNAVAVVLRKSKVALKKWKRVPQCSGSGDDDCDQHHQHQNDDRKIMMLARTLIQT